MKVLICADSHKRIDIFNKVIKKENPSIVIFAGDHSIDAEEMSYAYENIDFYIVRGNTDYYDDVHKDMEKIDIENKKILLVHGHLFGVKSSYKEIKRYSEQENVDICVFGHTHIPYLEEEKNITYCNPGALQDGNYAVLTNGKIKLESI